MTLYRIASDIHSELWEANASKALRIFREILPIMKGESDMTLLLAGDIGNYKQRVALEAIIHDCSDRFKEVYYVFGNHEYYRDDIIKANVNICDTITKYAGNVTYGNSFVSGNIIGATLWTDYMNNNPNLKIVAKLAMNDYKSIMKGEHNLTPDDIYLIHREHLAHINRFIDAQTEVVMTHHCPTSMSLSTDYLASELDGCYYTDLSNIILDNQPRMWVHGHVHTSNQYYVGRTLIVSNPYGYRNYQTNKDYDPELVIDLS